MITQHLRLFIQISISYFHRSLIEERGKPNLTCYIRSGSGNYMLEKNVHTIQFKLILYVLSVQRTIDITQNIVDLLLAYNKKETKI